MADNKQKELLAMALELNRQRGMLRRNLITISFLAGSLGSLAEPEEVTRQVGPHGLKDLQEALQEAADTLGGQQVKLFERALGDIRELRQYLRPQAVAKPEPCEDKPLNGGGESV